MVARALACRSPPLLFFLRSANRAPPQHRHLRAARLLPPSRAASRRRRLPHCEQKRLKVDLAFGLYVACTLAHIEYTVLGTGFFSRAHYYTLVLLGDLKVVMSVDNKSGVLRSIRRSDSVSWEEGAHLSIPVVISNGKTIEASNLVFSGKHSEGKTWLNMAKRCCRVRFPGKDVCANCPSDPAGQTFGRQSRARTSEVF